MKKYGFGVDIGGTTIKMGFFETEGKLIDKWEIKTDTTGGGENILADIAKAIDEKLAAEGISKDDVQGVGVGVPGPVRADGFVNRCVNLGWGVFDVTNALSELTGLTVKAGNDANVAALGEMWQGGAKGAKDVIFVTLGTGVGGGIIVDGKLVAGHDGAGGEIGHFTVNYNETEHYAYSVPLAERYLALYLADHSAHSREGVDKTEMLIALRLIAFKRKRGELLVTRHL